MELKDVLAQGPDADVLLQPEYAAAAEYILKAHSHGKFRMVCDTEQSENLGVLEEVAGALMESGEEWLVQLPSGEYLCGRWGQGWFSWGIGCPLSSAHCVLFMDDTYNWWS